MNFVPTEPELNLLPGLKAHPELEELLARFSDLIYECCCFGTHSMRWMAEESESAPDEHAGTAWTVSITVYRWGLELMGAIAAQLQTGWVDPCAVSCRSLFETAISFMYLTRADRIRRASSYHVCHLHRRRRFLESHLVGSKYFKQLESSLRKDELLRGVRLGERQEALRAKIEQIDAVLNSATNKEAAQEYARLSSERRGLPTWHEMFGGPRTIADMCIMSNRFARYEIYYRKWSEMAHGTRAFSGTVFHGGSSGIGFKQLGLIHALKENFTAAMASSQDILLAALSILSENKTDDFQRWWRNIRQEYHAVQAIELKLG